MRIGLIEQLEAIPAAEWRRLGDAHYPFLRHEFLLALERSGCIGANTDWQPAFLTLSDAQGLAAAVPAWLKRHSYGEFVFDFVWAQAYARQGLAYYPKLTVAAPFTPATGPRLLLREDLRSTALRQQLLRTISDWSDAQNLSSAHLLFLDADDREALTENAEWLLRSDVQFHWHNRGYGDFEEFLAGFTAEKRKKARRERRRVLEAGIHFETRYAGEATREEVLIAWQLHRLTFLRRGNEPYLNAEAFLQLARSLGESMVFKFAIHGSEIVAVAVLFIGGHTLYGRYWGAAENFHSLHFETCYHQGIELCIEKGLERFEPGTQGEHKVSRGFVPQYTYSAHRIADLRFRAAIKDYLHREHEAIERYANDIGEHVPYREAPLTLP
jgi:predicted N-acyltransferase